MAEPDAAGPGPVDSPTPTRPLTLVDFHREMERATAPLRAAAQQVERATAPLREAAERAEQAFGGIDSGIGRQLRDLFGEVVVRPHDSPSAFGLPKPGPGPNGPIGPWQSDPVPSPAHPLTSSATPAQPRVVLGASPEAMDALVERVAEAVVRRLARPTATKTATVKGRRGRRRREISVGGVDAALEALAEEDPSVRALAARALVERGVPYSRRTIEKSDTYKAWRHDLKALRMEAAGDGMADVLDAGLVRIRKRKPGRGRVVDPTIDPAVEKMTKEFLRLHGEEGLDGQ